MKIVDQTGTNLTFSVMVGFMYLVVYVIIITYKAHVKLLISSMFLEETLFRMLYNHIQWLNFLRNFGKISF